MWQCWQYHHSITKYSARCLNKKGYHIEDESNRDEGCRRPHLRKGSHGEAGRKFETCKDSLHQNSVSSPFPNLRKIYFCAT